MRRETSGRVGSPDLRLLAQTFADLKQQGQLEDLKTQGELAKAASKVPSPGHRALGSFGINKRELARRRWRLQCQSFHQQSLELSTFDTAEAILDHVQTPLSLTPALRLARATKALDKKVCGLDELSSTQTLQQYASQEGSELLTWVAAALPFTQRNDWQRVPHPTLPLLAWKPKSVTSSAVTACKTACGRQGQPLGAALERFWEEGHKTALGRGAEDDERVTPSLSPSTCEDAGVCICRAEGLQLKKLRNRFLRTMKDVFETKESKKKLADGFIVAHFKAEGTPLQQEGEEAKAESIYLHIALMYWSPYRPTFQFLEKADAASGQTSSALEYVQVPTSVTPQSASSKKRTPQTPTPQSLSHHTCSTGAGGRATIPGLTVARVLCSW